MHILAILVGLYAYSIYFLGIAKLLYTSYITLITLLFISVSLFIFFKKRKRFIFNLTTVEFLCALSLLLLGIVNFVGALGPELAFDALWYHLTLPKEFLLRHSIEFIPGGLLYYSVMPQLTEMLYIAALAIHNEVLAKVIHFLFGILCCCAIFFTTQKLSNRKTAFIAVLIFYGNLVVAWESITAYVDLARTFYEISALSLLLRYLSERKDRWLYLCAVMLGFAVSIKLLALGSVCIFLILLLHIHKKITVSIIKFFLISLSIPLPWFINSFISTGNPVYPVFTSLYTTSFSYHSINPAFFLESILKMFLYLEDPISPIYLIIVPLLITSFKNLSWYVKVILWYSFFSIIVWYLTPQTGGGRFILPYLPAFSILCAVVIYNYKNSIIKTVMLSAVILIACITICYRSFANVRYLPVILGHQTKRDFLCNNLNFKFSDFYDCDLFLEKTIRPTDKVLLFGVHNLFYVDIPYIHSSYAKPSDTFTHILTQNANLPSRYINKVELIYKNTQTRVKLYKVITKE